MPVVLQYIHVTLGIHGPRHRAYVERVAEANLDDDHQVASLATDPCHGLLCRRRWKRVTKRHDIIRDRLDGTSATVEPRLLNPQDGADQRFGDKKVSKYGNTWVLDVGSVPRDPALRRPAATPRPRQLHPIHPGDGLDASTKRPVSGSTL